jgi:DNA polymerase III subunit delta
MPRDSNVILLYGNDEFALRRRLDQFSASFTDPTSAAMNMARLEARSMTEDDLNNAVNAMPFLAKQRLVMLANPSVRYATPQSRKKFCEFLEKVPPTTRLVITEFVELKTYKDKARQESEDEKHWPVRWFKKAGLGLERYGLPAQWQMPEWIIKQAQEQGGQIQPPAAARLAEMVGPNPQQAAQEIAKLLTYVNWARPVSIDDLQAVSIVTAEADIFNMIDALVQGNGKRTQQLLHRLLEEQDAFNIWPLVIRQFRLLLLVREVMEQGGSQGDAVQSLAKPFGFAPFAVEKAYQQARRFSLAVLENVYRKLLEIDEAAKTGRMPLDVSLEMLVVELTN